MVLILAASFLHHALETLSPDKKEPIQSKVFSIPCLSLNIKTKNPKKIVQNLLVKDLKGKKTLLFGMMS